MALADDVSTELGRPLSEAESAQVTLWGSDLRLEIAERFEGREMPSEERILYVLRKVISAALRAPEPGVVSRDVQVDDARVSQRFESGWAGIAITPDLWAKLGWYTESTGIRTVRPYLEPESSPWPIHGNGSYFGWWPW